MADWPKVLYKEEGMREGMQIEDAEISVDDKVELLDALSETGLKNIVVGSFVSPKWTPQMVRIDDIVSKFTPKPVFVNRVSPYLRTCRLRLHRYFSHIDRIGLKLA